MAGRQLILDGTTRSRSTLVLIIDSCWRWFILSCVRLPLYIGNETVRGEIDIKLKPGKKLDHLGIKVEFVGVIGMYSVRVMHVIIYINIICRAVLRSVSVYRVHEFGC